MRTRHRAIFGLAIVCVAAGSALTLWLLNASADHICGPSGPTERPRNEEHFRQMCRHCGGTPSGSGFSLRCNISSRPTPRETEPQPDYEAERQRPAEIERQRQRELEQQRLREQEEARRRREEEFIRQRDEAVRSLRGVTPTDPGLRGVETIQDRTSPLFGLKGVGDTGIRDIKPDRSPRDVSTAWRQLHCAAEITGYALASAKPRDGRVVDLNEVRYLADEAIRALNGERLGVQCSSNVPPSPREQLDVGRLVPFYQTLLGATVREAEKLKDADQRLPEVRRKEEETRQRVEALRTQSGKPPESRKPSEQDKPSRTKDDPIAKAYEQQKAFQEQERKRIEEVYKKQKEIQSAMEEAMAALREAQRALNEVNAKKYQAEVQIQRYQNIHNRVLSNPDQADTLLRQIR